MVSETRNYTADYLSIYLSMYLSIYIYRVKGLGFRYTPKLSLHPPNPRA